MADARVQKKVSKGRHASTIKRHRQSLKRRARNKTIRTSVKTVVKNARTAISGKNKETTAKLVKEAICVLHKAASKGIIPKGRASRLSSRLAKAANTTV